MAGTSPNLNLGTCLNQCLEFLGHCGYVQLHQKNRNLPHDNINKKMLNTMEKGMNTKKKIPSTLKSNVKRPLWKLVQ